MIQALKQIIHKKKVKPKRKVKLQLIAHQRAAFDLIFRDRSTVTALCGGTGSGKTTCLAFFIVEKLREMPGIPGLLTGPTYATLNNTIEQLRPHLERCGVNIKSKLGDNKDPRLVLKFNGRSTIVKVKSMEAYTRIVSFEVGWWAMDEGGDTKRLAIMHCIQRLRYTNWPEKYQGKKHLQMFFTFTPKGKQQAVYKFLFDTKKSVTSSLTKNVIAGIDSSMNPVLPPEYLEMLEDVTQGRIGAQEKGGQFIDFEGACWKVRYRDYEYDPAKPWVLAIDFGKRKSAWGCFQEVERDIWVAFYAMLPERKTTPAALELLFERLRLFGVKTLPVAVYCDPAGDAETSNAYMTDIQYVNAQLKTSCIYSFSPLIRDVSRGITCVDNMFEGERFFVAEYLRKPIHIEHDPDYISYGDALEGTTFKEEKSTGKLRMVYEKDDIHDHAADMTRYFLMNKYAYLWQALENAKK